MESGTYEFFAYPGCFRLIPNPDEPEITNYKHQMTNKFQITISKSQIRSKPNCLEFLISVIVICPSTRLRVVRW